MRSIFLHLFLFLAIPVFAFPATESIDRAAASDVIYDGGDLKTLIKQLCTQIKYNVVFDETFRNISKYDIELKDVTTEGALKVIFIQNHAAARLIENRTVIVYFDNPNNNERFRDYPMWLPHKGQ